MNGVESISDLNLRSRHKATGGPELFRMRLTNVGSVARLGQNKFQVASVQVVCLDQCTFERAIFTRLLNEIPSRIDLFRMRSGVRFMMRAMSSSDFAALTSSMTRRSSANDHDLRFNDAPFI